MKKLALLGALSVACLMLAACGDGTPSKKKVDVKPVDTANQVKSPGEKFKNPGSQTGNPGSN